MTSLRGLLAAGKTIVAPGATDALSAKLIEAHGFDCVYIGSYATAASRFGIPDTGLVSSAPQTLRDAKTMAARIEAAVKARANPEFMIVARSDAFWGAAIVLYYAFSTLVQFEALSGALRDFQSGKRPGGQKGLENFLGYR